MQTVYVNVSDRHLAEMYIRLHDPQVVLANEFTEVCQALDDVFVNTQNGHGVLIDAFGHYSLVELSRCGTAAEKTLTIADSPRQLYVFAKNLLADRAE